MVLNVLPDKPKYREPCNGCGQCCPAELCEVGRMMFRDDQLPCPALVMSPDGKSTMCSLVATEIAAIHGRLVKYLSSDMNQARLAISDLLARTGREMTPNEVQEYLGLRASLVRDSLLEMIVNGKLELTVERKVKLARSVR